MGRLILFLLWIDDCLIVGPRDLVISETKKFQEIYDTTDEGWLHGKDGSYVGCKITFGQKKENLKLTQPVKIQRL